MSVALFIDANQYLNLYRMSGREKQLLDPVIEQKAHIFVCRQTVDEVMRNKLRCAELFLAALFKDKGKIPAMPELLLGKQEVIKIRKSLEEAKKAHAALCVLAKEALSKISRSDDDVSKRLEELFNVAVPATDAEMRRAKDRRELGNAPGKKGDPLGDQVVWEQFLTHCTAKKCTRLWIITDDGDFLSTGGGRSFLNSFLYRELVTACGASLEVRCFRNLIDGITDFAKVAGVPAEKLPTQEETTAIRKDLEAPLPFGWPPGNDGYAAVIEHYLRQQRFNAAVAAAGDFSDPNLALIEAMAES